MEYLNRWLLLVKERFNPAKYLIMILVFFSAHFFVYETDVGLISFCYFIPLFIAILLLFFHLRLFDEIKDFEFDKINFPDRPLPRGLLKKEDLLNVSILIIIIELMLFSYYGSKILLFAIIAILYSFLMYKEFYFGAWLRSHLTIYAVTHTFIATLISITIFNALADRFIFQMPLTFYYFSLGGWFLFNIFEFGRKTFALDEEKPGIDSYSKNFGRFGALLLVTVMMVVSTKFISISIIHPNIIVLYFWNIVLFIVGIFYVMFKKKDYAKVYRTLSTVHIVLIYGTIITSNLPTKL